MYVIYESPLQMLADSPSNYRREPAVMDFLSPVPTVWDETIAIEAKVGDYVIMARRSGKEWYVGGMTDWEARAFDVSLGFLEKVKNTNAMIFQDGKNAHRYAGDFWQSTKEVDANSVLKMKNGFRWRLGGSDY
jgi:alpha-glucosidase